MRSTLKDDQFSRLSSMFYYMKFRIGVCIPSTCDDTDMNSISTALSSNLRLNITIPDCRVKQELPLTKQQLVGGITFAVVLISVIIATLIDYLCRNKNISKHMERNGTQLDTDKCSHLNPSFSFDDGKCNFGSTIPFNGTTVIINRAYNQDKDLEAKSSLIAMIGKTFRSFSMLVNFRLYFCKQPNNPANELKHPSANRTSMIACLNGIRVLSLCWVIIANSYITLDPRATKRLVKTREASKDFFFQIIMQASLAIETFFFLSGLLMSLSFERRLKDTIQSDDASKTQTSGRHSALTMLKWIHFYVHRYIRMTSATMLVIALSMYAYHYGDGPLWFEATQKAHQSCGRNWWRHLLHVANFIDTRQMCFIHYWYIAADMQLFLFAPILMYLLYRFRRFGYLLIAIIGAASTGFVFYTTYSRNLPPTLLFYNSDPE